MFFQAMRICSMFMHDMVCIHCRYVNIWLMTWKMSSIFSIVTSCFKIPNNWYLKKQCQSLSKFYGVRFYNLDPYNLREDFCTEALNWHSKLINIPANILIPTETLNWHSKLINIPANIPVPTETLNWHSKLINIPVNIPAPTETLNWHSKLINIPANIPAHLSFEVLAWAVLFIV